MIESVAADGGANNHIKLNLYHICHTAIRLPLLWEGHGFKRGGCGAWGSATSHRESGEGAGLLSEGQGFKEWEAKGRGWCHEPQLVRQVGWLWERHGFKRFGGVGQGVLQQAIRSQVRVAAVGGAGVAKRWGRRGGSLGQYNKLQGVT